MGSEGTGQITRYSPLAQGLKHDFEASLSSQLGQLNVNDSVITWVKLTMQACVILSNLTPLQITNSAFPICKHVTSPFWDRHHLVGVKHQNQYWSHGKG